MLLIFILDSSFRDGRAAVFSFLSYFRIDALNKPEKRAGFCPVSVR